MDRTNGESVTTAVPIAFVYSTRDMCSRANGENGEHFVVIGARKNQREDLKALQNTSNRLHVSISLAYSETQFAMDNGLVWGSEECHKALAYARLSVMAQLDPTIDQFSECHLRRQTPPLHYYKRPVSRNAWIGLGEEIDPQQDSLRKMVLNNLGFGINLDIGRRPEAVTGSVERVVDRPFIAAIKARLGFNPRTEEEEILRSRLPLADFFRSYGTTAVHFQSGAIHDYSRDPYSVVGPESDTRPAEAVACMAAVTANREKLRMPGNMPAIAITAPRTDRICWYKPSSQTPAQFVDRHVQAQSDLRREIAIASAAKTDPRAYGKLGL